ncbi:lipase domain-containing protein [Phthorimaea operculella]|nr:lipase domain-containing protein [Phthorimaea operculella]
MSCVTLTTVAIFVGLLAVSVARPDPQSLPNSVFGDFDDFTAKFTERQEETANGIFGLVDEVSRDINREIADVKQPFETIIVDTASSQCSLVKNILGVGYSQYKGVEPDLNDMTLDFITRAYTITFNIDQAARSIPESKDFNPNETLYIFVHGFTGAPTKDAFGNIRKALFSQGHANVIALDGSAYIGWLYLRSTTYVRFMGQKLGEVLADMVQINGVDPRKIHVIGHSLGAHISGFCGKTFQKLTNATIGRISGLDPAGPCYTAVGEDLRLKKTDASYVDVIHTDGGVFGLSDAVGHSDYYPNSGAEQPDCLLQTCSHSRAWLYFAESVVNPQAFPAVKCDSWGEFRQGSCQDEISYMGFPSQPGTTGKFYLQTEGDTPFSRGENGLTYRSDNGIIKNVTEIFFG